MEADLIEEDSSQDTEEAVEVGIEVELPDDEPAEMANDITAKKTTIGKKVKFVSVRKRRVSDSDSSTCTEGSTPCCTSKDKPPRGGWSCQGEFLLTCVAFCVGVGNFWAFEYNLWFTGGSSFFIPYTILMLCCGYPLIVLEMTLGQYIHGNPLSVWRVVPAMKGIGVCMLVCCVIMAVYRNSVLSWHLYYAYSSFFNPLPWTGCNHTWNTENCWQLQTNCSEFVVNENEHDHSHPLEKNLTFQCGGDLRITADSSAHEFFNRNIMDMSEGLHELIGIRWGLVVSGLAVWLLTCLGSLRGMKLMSKVLYLTLSTPLILLLVLIVRVCLVEGSLEGVVYYVVPHFSALNSYEVWYAACIQMFFTLSPGFGVYIVLASYNDFHFNYKRWAIAISLISILTSFLMGLLIFALLGALAKKLNAPIHEIIVTGYNLCYIVLPQALSILPRAQVWSACFYIMLFLQGISGQLTIVETLVTTCLDQWSFKDKPNRPALLAWICIGMFFAGLMFVNRGSIYVMVLMEAFDIHWSALILSTISGLVLSYWYGFAKMGSAVEAMLGYRLSDWWQFVWKFVVPCVVIFTIVCDSLRHLSLTYWGYEYPSWSLGIGFCILLFPLLCVPICFVIACIRTRGPLKLRWLQLSKSPMDFGPFLDSHRNILLHDIPEYIETDPEEFMIDLCSSNEEKVKKRLNERRLSAFNDLDTGSNDSEAEDNMVRGNWTNRTEFMLTTLGYTVGLGNVWRFPYLVYRNGGGAFFLAYFLMMVFMGWPLYYLELIIGQYSSRGPTKVWACVPVLRGLGFSILCIAVYICIYYNVIVSWTVYYMFASMQGVLPWASCNNTWNTVNCSEDKFNSSLTNLMPMNLTGSLDPSASIRSPSEEYYIMEVLGLSLGISDIGSLRWHLSLCLLFAWTVVFLSIIRGIKSAGKVAYVAATLPYVVLTILLIRAMTLEGFRQGIQFYITPVWSKLLDGAVWYDAAVQVLFSLGTGYGGLIMLASYNTFHNDCSKDAFYLAFADFATSAFSGFVVFAILGVMANSFDTTIENVISSETGLAFIAFPDAVTRMPFSPIWSVLFFILLFLIGLDSQMVMTEIIAVSIVEEIPKLAKRKVWVSLGLCIMFFFLGLLMVTDGGSYVLVLVDNYSTSWPVLVIVLLETLGLTWSYGMNRLSRDCKSMIGEELSPYWKAIWGVICPLIVAFVLIFKCATFTFPKYDDYEFPLAAHICGFVLVAVALIPIPVYAVYTLATEKGTTFTERWKRSCRPAKEYGPMVEKNRQYAAYFRPEIMRQSSAVSTDSDAASMITDLDDQLCEEITVFPKPIGELKDKVKAEFLTALAEAGHDEETTIQWRQVYGPTVNDNETQTVLPPDDGMENLDSLHEAPSGRSEEETLNDLRQQRSPSAGEGVYEDDLELALTGVNPEKSIADLRMSTVVENIPDAKSSSSEPSGGDDEVVDEEQTVTVDEGDETGEEYDEVASYDSKSDKDDSGDVNVATTDENDDDSDRDFAGERSDDDSGDDSDRETKTSGSPLLEDFDFGMDESNGVTSQEAGMTSSAGDCDDFDTGLSGVDEIEMTHL